MHGFSIKQFGHALGRGALRCIDQMWNYFAVLHFHVWVFLNVKSTPKTQSQNQMSLNAASKLALYALVAVNGVLLNFHIRLCHSNWHQPKCTLHGDRDTASLPLLLESKPVSFPHTSHSRRDKGGKNALLAPTSKLNTSISILIKLLFPSFMATFISVGLGKTLTMIEVTQTGLNQIGVLIYSVLSDVFD